jgi:hypothetical protein
MVVATVLLHNLPIATRRPARARQRRQRGADLKERRLRHERTRRGRVNSPEAPATPRLALRGLIVHSQQRMRSGIMSNNCTGVECGRTTLNIGWQYSAGGGKRAIGLRSCESRSSPKASMVFGLLRGGALLAARREGHVARSQLRGNAIHAQVLGRSGEDHVLLRRRHFSRRRRLVVHRRASHVHRCRRRRLRLWAVVFRRRWLSGRARRRLE